MSIGVANRVQHRIDPRAPTQYALQPCLYRVSDRVRGGNVSTHRYELASSCSSTYQSSASGSLSAQRSDLTSLCPAGYITSPTHDDSLPPGLTRPHNQPGTVRHEIPPVTSGIPMRPVTRYSALLVHPRVPGTPVGRSPAPRLLSRAYRSVPLERSFTP